MRSRVLILAGLLVALAWMATAAVAPVTIKYVPARQLGTVDGAAVYEAYCASCHGLDGRGDARAAQALSGWSPGLDLTRLAGYGRPFDHAAVLMAIEGEPFATSHAMPEWTRILKETYADRGTRSMMLHNLVTHLESLQAVPLRTARVVVREEVIPTAHVAPLDGAELWTAYCADCHGADARGDGRLAPALGEAVPDLTQMTDAAGRFDHGALMGAIATRHMIPAHSSALDWNQAWAKTEGNRQRRVLILHNLVGHLETLQAASVPPE